jgi:U3 small nucleolar RNA-associated protein 14
MSRDKIKITDLIDNQTITEHDYAIKPNSYFKDKTRNEIEEFIAMKRDKEFETIRENNFYNVFPKTNLEKKLDAILNKKSLSEIRDRKNFQHQYNSKMQKVKRIKSKTYRRFKREAKKTEQEQVVTKKPEISINYDIQEEDQGMEELEIENAPIFEFSGQIEEKENNEIVKLAFESEMNENQKDFIEEKEKIINDEAPVTSETILPGWGGWAGPGLKITKNKHNVIKENKDGIKNTNRKDFEFSHVIINETKEKLDDKFKCKVPFGYTKEEYLEKLNRPISKECNTNRIFNKIIKPKTKTRKGTIIEPQKFITE